MSETVFLSHGVEYVPLNKMGVLFLARPTSNDYINGQINLHKVRMIKEILEMMRAEDLQNGLNQITQQEINSRTMNQTVDPINGDQNHTKWPLIDLTKDDDQDVPEGVNRVNLDAYVTADQSKVERLEDVPRDAMEKFYESLPREEKVKFNKMIEKGEISIIDGPSASHPMQIVVHSKEGKDQSVTYAQVVTQKASDQVEVAPQMTNLGNLGAKPRVSIVAPTSGVPTPCATQFSHPPPTFSCPPPSSNHQGDVMDMTSAAGLEKSARQVNTFYDSLNDTPAHNSTNDGSKWQTCRSFTESVLGVAPVVPYTPPVNSNTDTKCVTDTVNTDSQCVTGTVNKGVSKDASDTITKVASKQASDVNFGFDTDSEDDIKSDGGGKTSWSADEVSNLMKEFNDDMKEMSRIHQHDMAEMKKELVSLFSEHLAMFAPKLPPRDDVYQNVAGGASGIPYVRDDTIAKAGRAFAEGFDKNSDGGSSPILHGSERYSAAPGGPVAQSGPSAPLAGAANVLEYRNQPSPLRQTVERIASKNKEKAPPVPVQFVTGDDQGPGREDITMVSMTGSETPRTKTMIDQFEATLSKKN